MVGIGSLEEEEEEDCERKDDNRKKKALYLRMQAPTGVDQVPLDEQFLVGGVTAE